MFVLVKIQGSSSGRAFNIQIVIFSLILIIFLRHVPPIKQD